MVSSNPRIERLAEQAKELARTTPDDAECVRILTETAGRHRRDLSKAAAIVRFGGFANELRANDRANRLLLTAFTGEPVGRPPAELETLFARVDELYTPPVENGFRILAAISPELQTLDAQWSSRTADGGDVDELWNELIGSLAPVVGPDAVPGVSDPLLRTKSAHNIARLYLALQAGLLGHIDYDQ